MNYVDYRYRSSHFHFFIPQVSAKSLISGWGFFPNKKKCLELLRLSIETSLIAKQVNSFSLALVELGIGELEGWQ